MESVPPIFLGSWVMAIDYWGVIVTCYPKGMINPNHPQSMEACYTFMLEMEKKPVGYP